MTDKDGYDQDIDFLYSRIRQFALELSQPSVKAYKVSGVGIEIDRKVGVIEIFPFDGNSHDLIEIFHDGHDWCARQRIAARKTYTADELRAVATAFMIAAEALKTVRQRGIDKM